MSRHIPGPISPARECCLSAIASVSAGVRFQALTIPGVRTPGSGPITLNSECRAKPITRVFGTSEARITPHASRAESCVSQGPSSH